MYKLVQIIVVLIILIVLCYFYKMKYSIVFQKLDLDIKKENFRVDSQNWTNNNAFDVANRLEYGTSDNMKGMYQSKSKNVMGPSDTVGVDQNSNKDVYDNRGYKWSANAQDPQVDVQTHTIDDAQLRNAFERTYMLDPDGSVAQYDITYNKISPSCCPAQYSPPFKVGDKDSTNCEYAQQYVANNYSGMNYADGYGCVCMTPKQADFYGSRGGNTD